MTECSPTEVKPYRLKECFTDRQFNARSLELEENSDVFWLRLTGQEGVKAFLRSEIGLG